MKKSLLVSSLLSFAFLVCWAQIGDISPSYATSVKRHVSRPVVHAKKPAPKKEPVKTLQEKRDELNCPHEALGDCIKYFQEIEDLDDRNVALRTYAVKLIRAGDKEDGITVLGIAEKEADAISDNYTQANNLRYIGEQYYRLQKDEEAKRVFDKALDLDWRITYIPRRLSGIIGLIETQKTIQYDEGVRNTAMWAIRNGLLNQVADEGKPGETNRLFSNLSRNLYPSQVLEILGVLRGIDNVDFRKHVIYKLNMIYFSRGEDPAPVKPEQITEAMPQLWKGTDNFEQAMIHTLFARLDPEHSEEHFAKAKELTDGLPDAEHIEKAKKVMDAAKTRM